MCHMLRPGGPLTAPVYAPRGHDRPRQLVWFWRSVGLRQGGYGGACWGMGLQMGRSRRQGREGRRETGRENRTGWTVRRITEHKRHVSKTEWPVTTYDPMDDNGLNLRGLGSRVCGWVCVFVGRGTLVCWCPKALVGSERIEAVALWMM